MESARLLLVGFVDVLLVRRGSNSKEIVERDAYALGSFNLIAQTEDFLVCELEDESVIDTFVVDWAKNCPEAIVRTRDSEHN